MQSERQPWTGVHILRDLCRRNGMSQQATDEIANLFLFHTRELGRRQSELPTETSSDDDEDDAKSSDSDSS